MYYEYLKKKNKCAFKILLFIDEDPTMNLFRINHRLNLAKFIGDTANMLYIDNKVMKMSDMHDCLVFINFLVVTFTFKFLYNRKQKEF
jgi:hypothetical protein